MYTRKYALVGFLFGLAFPVLATVIESVDRRYGMGLAGLVRAQATAPLLWIIDTAPVFLGAAASYVGRRQDQAVAFAAAQGLLSTVSSFSSMTAETAASVRETTATMGQL